MRIECLVALLSVAVSQPAIAAAYRLEPLATVAKLGAFTPLVISDDGWVAGSFAPADGADQVVLITNGNRLRTADPCGMIGVSGGRSVAAASPYSVTHFFAGMCQGTGFRYDAATKTASVVSVPNFDGMSVGAVGPNGVTAGNYNEHSGGNTGFVEKKGAYANFSGGNFTYPRGINLRGTIYGSGVSLEGTEAGFLLHPDGKIAFVNWPTSGYSTMVNDANGHGQAVGGFFDTFVQGSTIQAFLWQNQKVSQPLLPHAVNSVASAVNEAGDVAGTYTDASGRTHGFVRQSASGRVLGFDPPATAGALAVTAINNHAAVTGYYSGARGKTVAFIARCGGTGCF